MTMTDAHCHILAVSAYGDHAPASQQCHGGRPPRHQEAEEETKSGCRLLLCCWFLGGLAFSPIYVYISTMVYHYTVQEFEKSNTAMTTGEDYPPSIFGIMIGREGGTYLPRLGFAIYMGVLAKRVVCRQVLQSDIWHFTMGWTTGLFVAYHVVLPGVLVLGKQTPPTFPPAAALLVLVMNWIEIYFWFFFAQTIQVSKFPIPKEAKEEGDGNNDYAV
jgi:hypothetical protein